MARRKPKNEPTEATRFSNSAIRKEMIQKAGVQYDHLMREIEGHQVHIKAARTDIKDILDKLRDEIGIERKYFEWTIKHLIQPEEAVRDANQDNVREVFEALQPTEQLDWLKPEAPLNQPHGGAAVNLSADVKTDRTEFPT